MSNAEEGVYTLPVLIAGKNATFSISSTSFSLLYSKRPSVTPKPTTSTPTLNVIWVEFADGNIKISFLAKRRDGLILSHIVAKPEHPGDDTKEWVRHAMALAYADVKPQRRLKILINPKGGPGKAQAVFRSTFEPILQAANCIMDVTVTTHPNHAAEIAQKLPLDFDAIVTLSGDGLPHEVYNGLATRPDARKALSSIAVVPVPTGSANGFCVNLLGVKHSFDIGYAALNVIKGKPFDVDICSVTQGNKTTYSFFSQCVGLMAELDLGTEHLRWMGETRFIYGFIRHAIKNKKCAVKLSMKVVESDKEKLFRDYQSTQKSSPADKASPQQPDSTLDSLPPVLYAHESENEGWTTFDKPLVYVYGGLVGYVARDFLQFPCANPQDGLVDIVVHEQPKQPLVTLLMMLGAEKGTQFWKKNQHYYKAHAYRITPTGKGHLALDGEAYPFEPFHVEVHPGLGRTLSLYGRYIYDWKHGRG